MKPFGGKIALITGSARGIGSAIAIHFAELGADIIINYIHNQQFAEKTAQEISIIGRKVLIVRANIGKIEGLQKLFTETEENSINWIFLYPMQQLVLTDLQWSKENPGGTIHLMSMLKRSCSEPSLPLL